LDSVRTISYHPNRKILLSTGRDGSAKLWNAESDTHHPAILGNLALHVENIPAAGFIGPDTVVTGSWDQKLAIWNIKELIK
jgi:WD40 repeat protein